MDHEERPASNEIIRANDNRKPGSKDNAREAPCHPVDKAVLAIARLVGRIIARDHFETLQAANDNALLSSRKVFPEPEVEARNEKEER